jgi:hypothetical protein
MGMGTHMFQNTYTIVPLTKNKKKIMPKNKEKEIR